MIRYQPKQTPLSKRLSYSELSRKDQGLKQLVSKAEELQQIEHAFIDKLPATLKPYFKVIGLQHNILSLTCSSASAKMRFTMSQGTIVDALRSVPLFRDINKIKIKIRPEFSKSGKERQIKEMSEQNRRLIEMEAGQTEDPALRSALLKLARKTDQHPVDQSGSRE